ncbi:Arc family DNA-binding protein [Roseateles noduli]|uniref:Arc family DNA-binding protein n=1 Tax=Roseateles noduli TaxID=2052484 RepID=UPI003D65A946
MATDRHQAPSYPLRLDEDLRTQLQAAAEEKQRSLNAEIQARLKKSLELDGVGGSKASVAARLLKTLADADALARQLANKAS